jgi:hypothetical protein
MVLAVHFDTTTLTWSLTARKQHSLQRLLWDVISVPQNSLLQLQQLVGSLNNFWGMCLFLSAFCHPHLQVLNHVGDDLDTILHLFDQTIADL